MAGIELINLKVMGDDRGSLVALESHSNVPFEIKRVYYIYATKENVSRGFHAHKKLKQFLVCVAGKCRIHLDDGEEKREVILDTASNGLLIDGLIWREMHDFTADCVLLVLASEHYDETDYIRNYDDFLKECNNEAQ